MLIIAIVLCFSLFSCKHQFASDSESNTDISDEACSEPERVIDFEAVLRSEAFNETEGFSNALNEVVVFENFVAENNILSFQVNAPYIYDDLLSWFESQEDISDDLMDQKIGELLNGEKRVVIVNLKYEVQGDAVIFDYTNEYLSAVGCGIREFYAYLYDCIIGGIEND